MAEDKVYLLTQEAYNKMKEELAHREGELREEIAHKIAVARAEGDLSENGGYQAAREAQSKNEGRITELTVKLRDSKIIENAPEGTVGEGSVVTIELNGKDARGRVISRSVAQDGSRQVFRPVMVGNSQCFGHVQCDSIIMGAAHIQSVPAITANCPDAQLIHEAAIGKIAGDQLLKLETLGLTEEEAEDTILRGFLA